MKSEQKSNIEMLMQGSFSQAFVRLNSEGASKVKKKRRLFRLLSLVLPKSILRFFIL
jgi:hypothetical protein